MASHDTTSSFGSPDEMPALAVLGRGLIGVSRGQRVLAILLPLMGAVGLGICLAFGWPVAAVLAAVVYTFYSYGSTSHDLVHGNLGFGRAANHVWLSVIELAGLRSGHAYLAAHLHHHARFPHDDDVEGAAAHGTLVQALLAGPGQQLRIWCWAVRNARRYRALIVIEGIACAAMVLSAIAASPWTQAPTAYVALVAAGSWTFPLITAYLPHLPAGQGRLRQTRRFRGVVVRVLFRRHLYHLEHHLYPAVPHQHWDRLATRLDPYLDRAGIEPVKLGF